MCILRSCHARYGNLVVPCIAFIKCHVNIVSAGVQSPQVRGRSKANTIRAFQPPSWKRLMSCSSQCAQDSPCYCVLCNVLSAMQGSTNREEPSWLTPDEEQPSQPKPKPSEKTPFVQATDTKSSTTSQAQLTQTQKLMKPEDVRRGFVLSLFITINVIAVFSALSVAAAEVLSIIYHDLSYQAIALRIYGIIFCVGVIFSELGWTQAVRDTVIIQNWLTRGCFYVFVGLLALEQGQERTAAEDFVNLYIFAAGLGMIGLGVLYAIMGVCCCKRIYDARAARYRQLRSTAELQEAIRLQAAM